MFWQFVNGQDNLRDIKSKSNRTLQLIDVIREFYTKFALQNKGKTLQLYLTNLFSVCILSPKI